MESKAIKLASSNIVFYFSENTYRWYKLAHVCAIVVCALAMALIIYTNNTQFVNAQLANVQLVNVQLVNVQIVSIAVILNTASIAPVYLGLKRASNAEANERVNKGVGKEIDEHVDEISYLPLIHIGALLNLNGLYFYATYLFPIGD